MKAIVPAELLSVLRIFLEIVAALSKLVLKCGRMSLATAPTRHSTTRLKLGIFFATAPTEPMARAESMLVSMEPHAVVEISLLKKESKPNATVPLANALRSILSLSK